MPAVVSKSPGTVEQGEKEAFDCFDRLISIEAAIFNSVLLRHRVGTTLDISPKTPTTGPIALPPWP